MLREARGGGRHAQEPSYALFKNWFYLIAFFFFFFLVRGAHFVSLVDLGAHYLAQASLEFTEIRLPQPPQFWD